MKRREFLQLSLLGSMTSQLPELRVAAPRVNGGINVLPFRRFDDNAGSTPPIIVPRLVDLQMRLLYELGFEQMRITLSFELFGPNFLAAIPFVRAARALGIDVLGIVDQFSGFDLLRALRTPETREEVLETYSAIFGSFVPAASDAIESPGAFAAQVLNEPTFFKGVAPDVYVRDFLRPGYLHLKEDGPDQLVVAAAPVSSAEGFLRFQKMLETGAENFCDRIAVHAYSTRFIERLGELTDKPVWVTESGVEGVSRHLDWYTSTFDEIRRAIPQAERLYWFDLFDRTPNSFRLVDIVPDPELEFVAVPESTELLSFLDGNVRAASGGAELIPYEELIPDITLYFPTEEDIRIIERTSFGLGLDR